MSNAIANQLYLAYLGRPGDTAWRTSTTAVLNGGAPSVALQNAFYSAAVLDGTFSLSDSSSTLVNKIFLNIFGFSASTFEQNAWAVLINNGTITAQTAAWTIFSSYLGATNVPSSYQQPAQSKLIVLDAYTNQLANDPAANLSLTSIGGAAASAARTFISTISSQSTAATALTSIVSTVSSASTALTGTTFTATTNTDSFTGTTNNDLFVGDNSTLGTADVITGGSGTDTLNYTSTATAAMPASSISGVEIFNVRQIGGALNSTDLSIYSGLTTFNVDRGTAAYTVTKLASGGTFGVIGNSSVSSTGALALGYADAATAAVINIQNGVLGGQTITLTGTGLLSTTINSTGAANTIDTFTDAGTSKTLTINATTALTTGAVTGTGTTNVVISGAGNVTTNLAAVVAPTITVSGTGTVALGTLNNAVTTLTSTQTSGGVSATLGTAVTQKVTLGAGNDVISMPSLVLTTGSIDGGAGTDTLDIGANVGNANTSALAAKFTNFEALRVNGTFDASLISSITAIQLSGNTNNITGMTATQAAAVTARADLGNTTLALANATGTSDVLSITLGTGTTTAAATNAGTLTVTGFETLNLAATPGPTATTGANKISTIGAFSGATLNKINLTGTSFALSDIATTVAVTIDGSALTGDGSTTPVGFTTAGNAVNGSTITGSAFADTFTIGAEGSTYNGGAGNDTFNTTTAIATADGTTDLVLVGGAGTDTLRLTTFSNVTDAAFTNVTGMERLILNTVGGATTAVGAVLGSAAKTAFADGVTVTSGQLATATTYSFASGLYDKAVNLTLVADSVGTSNAHNITVATGSANDTVSITATSWQGVAGGTGGTISVSTGAGNDTITVSTGTQLAQTTTAPVVITGGLGADTITSAGTNVTTGAGVLTTTYVIAAGDSLVSAYDSITGFDLGTAALLPNTLDLAGTSTVTAYAATAATGFTAAQLSVAVATTTGLVTFSGTSAATATLAEKIAAVQSVVTTNNGDVAVFTHGANSYVFQNNTTDTLVELVGVSATNIITANANTAGSVLVI